MVKDFRKVALAVLNLIINGLPSKLGAGCYYVYKGVKVLNLIINGLPSKQK